MLNFDDGRMFGMLRTIEMGLSEGPVRLALVEALDGAANLDSLYDLAEIKSATDDPAQWALETLARRIAGILAEHYDRPSERPRLGWGELPTHVTPRELSFTARIGKRAAQRLCARHPDRILGSSGDWNLPRTALEGICKDIEASRA